MDELCDPFENSSHFFFDSFVSFFFAKFVFRGGEHECGSLMNSKWRIN